MHQREYVCKNPNCDGYQEVASATADEIMDCPGCLLPLEVALYPIASVWVGDITSKYLDRTKENGNKPDGGHWVFERGGDPKAKPVPRYITSWSEQKDHCKREGLARPQECGNNYQVAEDGKSILNPYGGGEGHGSIEV